MQNRGVKLAKRSLPTDQAKMLRQTDNHLGGLLKVVLSLSSLLEPGIYSIKAASIPTLGFSEICGRYGNLRPQITTRNNDQIQC